VFFVPNIDDEWEHEGMPLGFLGLNGFFDKFKVTIYRKSFDLEPYDDENKAVKNLGLSAI